MAYIIVVLISFVLGALAGMYLGHKYGRAADAIVQAARAAK